FDLSMFREDTWQGRPVYVVGAKTGDLHPPQMDRPKESVFCADDSAHRARRSANARDAIQQVSEARAWLGVAGSHLQRRWKVVTIEGYSELRADVTLDPKLFDPQYFATVHC